MTRVLAAEHDSDDDLLLIEQTEDGSITFSTLGTVRLSAERAYDLFRKIAVEAAPLASGIILGGYRHEDEEDAEDEG
jgi:hypothetical protein